MIYLLKELLDNGETAYSIRNKVANGTLFLVEHGVYSDEPQPFIDEVYICKKYPHAILTGISAFFIYGLTDHIPEAFFLATAQHSYPIRKKEISQSYQDESFFLIGKSTKEYNGGFVNIYDIERTFIELVRLKEKYSPEIYYEVLNSFRKIKDKLDFYKINEYLKVFKNAETLIHKIKELI